MNNISIKPKDAILVAILVIIIIGVLYYLCYYSPLQDEISSVKAQSADLDLTVAETQQKVNSMDAMQAELDEIFSRPKDEITEIAPYDNAKTVMNFLNGILSRANEYDLASPDPEITEDGMVRRSVNLSFSCSDYATAKTILRDLASWNYRCLLQDVVISGDNDGGSFGTTGGAVTVSATMTFFESQKIA